MSGRLVGLLGTAGGWTLGLLLGAGAALGNPADAKAAEPFVLRAGPVSIDLSTGHRARMLPLVLADIEVFSRRHYPDQVHSRAQVEGLRRFRAPGALGQPAVEVAPGVESVTWLELAALQDLLELYLASRR